MVGICSTPISSPLFKQDAAVHAELAAAEQVLLSSTVLGELYYGAAQSGRPQQNRERLEPLRKDLFQAGRALGTATANALSAGAVRAFTAATRLLGRAFWHHHDRGFGPDDDGLGR